MADSRHYQRRINQKINAAKTLLREDSDAAIEGALWHLSIAYQAWLAEIATDKHHPLGLPKVTAQALADSTEKHIPAALAECLQLEQNPDSWLGRMLCGLALASDIENKPPATARPDMIVLQTEPAQSLPNQQQALSMLRQLEAMVDRYRDAMQEY